ncbi:response regulator transcription factor [Shewanella schlegeliana]|uniref:Response regulator transcription factor n=1 Tax=Shewanella schlegeliana TaxID=190308 RepID=A0ABS1SZB9_9GAMM|nr:response regulator transcription factor [Shewanella schlegeliana]MBL4913890.1 response regulator transcription factor [Shewanella schlegeliana]MCL1108726.1 response regulator transcription factor [Shewanella schlegeliana]
MKQILLVDADSTIRGALQQALVDEGYHVAVEDCAEQVLLNKTFVSAELILLTLDMSDTSALERFSLLEINTPIIVISPSDAEEDRIRAYELGADDFIAQPFNQRELLVRIQALIRRVGKTSCKTGVDLGLADKITFDDNQFIVSISKISVALTQTEFSLFKYLFERKGEVVTKQELQRRILHKELGQFDRNLDMHISNTRRKLAANELPKSLINTVRGKGYSISALA